MEYKRAGWSLFCPGRPSPQYSPRGHRPPPPPPHSPLHYITGQPAPPSFSFRPDQSTKHGIQKPVFWPEKFWTHPIPEFDIRPHGSGSGSESYLFSECLESTCVLQMFNVQTCIACLNLNTLMCLYFLWNNVNMQRKKVLLLVLVVVLKKEGSGSERN